ncbi:MAG: MarR family transcriptional regulator [Thaumarchaeota archaeon]|nr:MarR family transcriptional regulator [Nitrososphaerota archaeon]
MQGVVTGKSISSLENEPLENTAWRNLSDTYKIVYSYIMSDLRQYGLTPPQYAVLRAIGNSPMKQLSMSEIGKEMYVTFANITTIVDNLEKSNYVRRLRDSSDRRLVKVELTSTGAKLFKRIFRSHRKQVAKLMQVLNKNELGNLIIYTDSIKKSVNKNSQSR